MASRIPAAERRRQLVDAAFTVVARDGLAAATTRAICEQAGVSQSVFHYCFASKRELLHALITETLRGLVDRAGTIAVPAEGGAGTDLLPNRHPDLHSVLSATFEGLWAEARARPQRQLALYELTTAALRDPDLADLAGLQYRSYFQAMEAGIEAIEVAGRCCWTVPRAVVARTAISLFDGLVLGWLSDGDEAAAHRTLQASVDALAALGVPRDPAQ